MILKGQNFRILTYNAIGDRWAVIGMATNCTVTINSNTESAEHKDIVGMAANPAVVSNNWSVQVDSLDVADVGAMLTAIKNSTQFKLRWDETSTGDNQALNPQTYGRMGMAYLNDATFQFDNRTNSTKGLQFTGSGPLAATDSMDVDEDGYTPGSFTKGQFVRLFLASDNTATPISVLGSALTLALHVSVTLEDVSTKDTDGNWQVQEPTGISYDINTSALIRGGDTITSSVGAKGLADLEDIQEAGEPVKWQIANVSGDNQRTKGNQIAQGSCIITSLTLNGPNRQNADYTAQLTGYGDIN
jgi:hypothetical protein